jgi:hypothetical protein
MTSFVDGGVVVCVYVCAPTMYKYKSKQQNYSLQKGYG